MSEPQTVNVGLMKETRGFAGAVTSRGLPEPERLLEELLEHRGWDIRKGQTQMVEIIADEVYFDKADVKGCSVNAPVGTGKTLGYLVGALPSDRRIVVCTSTKALQDQIARSELPRLASDLHELYGYDLRYAVMKGKGNYACPASIRALLDGEGQDDDEDLFGDMFQQLEDSDRVILQAILDQTQNAIDDRNAAMLDCGDLIQTLPAGVRRLIVNVHSCEAKGMKWWQYVDEFGEPIPDISEIDEGQFYTRQALPLTELIDRIDCSHKMASALALSSDVVVMNTNLLAAELLKARLGYEMMALQLAGTQVVVVDEAHHLVRILTEALSLELDVADVYDSADTYFRRLAKHFPDRADHLERAKDIIARAHIEMDDVIASGSSQSDVRYRMSRRLWELKGDLEQVMIGVDDLHLPADAGPKVAKAVRRTLSDLDDDVFEPIASAAVALTQQVEVLEDEDKEFVYDVTYTGFHSDDADESLVVNMVPLDLSFFRGELAELNKKPNIFIRQTEGVSHSEAEDSTLIMCSGTITAEAGNVIGMDDGECYTVKSPFDPKRARLFIPDDLPNPNNADWMPAAWEYARDAIKATGGRTLFLTTSLSRMESFYDLVAANFRDLNVMRQNDGRTRGELLDQFTQDETSVLVATTSFWEGVDVPGRALSLVIIDKIPFPVMDDPVFKARERWVEKHGGNPFMQVQVDHAAIMVAQGIGRLIRAESDMGGILMLDSRVVNARYGDAILKIVPASTPVAQSEQAFLKWLRWLAAPTDTMPEPNVNEWAPLRTPRPRRGRR